MKRKGFTLVEMLVVTAIISILAGMVGSAAFIARKRAYMATAMTEVQQLAMAIKAVWLSSPDGKWPSAFTGGGETGKEVSGSLLKYLQGENDKKHVYMEITPDKMIDSAFCDPWGNPYRISVETPTEVSDETTYEVVVSFLNQERYYSQGEGLYYE